MSYVATRLLETHLVLEKTEAMSSGFGNKIIQKNKRMWHNYGIQYIVHSLYFGPLCRYVLAYTIQFTSMVPYLQRAQKICF
jgi:hypothetical protein